MLAKRPRIQAGNECLDCKERGGQDASEYTAKSKSDGDTLRHPNHSTKHLAQGIVTVISTNVIVSFFEVPVGTIRSPPDGDLALDDLPVLDESGGPQNECGGVIRDVR